MLNSLSRIRKNPKKYVINNKRYYSEKKNRVVVTGLGLVTPLGLGIDKNWTRLINGENGIRKITEFDTGKIPVKIAATVPQDEDYHVKVASVINSSVCISDSFADEALKDSNWLPKTEYEQDRSGVSVGSCIGSIMDIESTSILYHEGGYHKVSPYYTPRILPNMAAGNISIKFGLKGPNHCVSTACSTGAHSIGDAFLFISNGLADVMVAGATDASISPTTLSGFARARALTSKFNDSPELASRPFDKDRSGFVMGEGAGILILENLQHALNRNAKIYAEIIGYGLNGDAENRILPSVDGKGALKCMKMALKNAKISPNLIDYINAHATSTPQGDRIENMAIEELMRNLNNDVLVSSTKGATGHLLGAAGAIEAIFTVMAIKTGMIPPTINLNSIEEEFKLNYVPNKSTTRNVRYALTNSFGFGGTNCSLVFSKYLE